MKRTTAEMHEALGEAVLELRETMKWGQADLARQITIEARRKLGLRLIPAKQVISRWERGLRAPSPDYRMVLCHLALRDERTKHLADTFRLPTQAWRIAAGWRRLPVTDRVIRRLSTPSKGKD